MTASGCHTWVAGAQALGPSAAAFPGALAESWIRTEAARIQASAQPQSPFESVLISP